MGSTWAAAAHLGVSHQTTPGNGNTVQVPAGAQNERVMKSNADYLGPARYSAHACGDEALGRIHNRAILTVTPFTHFTDIA